ncbi:universal stress protein [Thiocapsa sp.]|uniref:universal stress protein n=1 Tax=Thiocapsa sp. TaxID=2024551 RepID=UPI0025F70369|nr:universal stress protein [Thiocapsa sp.]
MSAGAPSGRIRRIAVALDASPHSLQALALAAGIAAALNAELEGVFVEDTELLRLAGLPFLRELRIATLCESILDADRLQRELRAAARGVRERLERTAGELGVAWSFRVWRGDLEAEILGAALDAELFALGRIGRFAPLRRRPRPIAPKPRDSGLLVGVLYSGSAGATRALSIAVELGIRHAASLVIILQPAMSADAATLRRHVLAQLGSMREQTRLVSLEAADAAGLAATVRNLGIDLLILDEANPLLGRASLWTSLETLGCPVVIGR